jgi:hypothetical protein
MAKVINLDEMQEILRLLEHKDAERYAVELERLGDEMARTICHEIGALCIPAECMGTAFAGTCVLFYPAKAKDKCPTVMKRYDKTGDWKVPPWAKCGR